MAKPTTKRTKTKAGAKPKRVTVVERFEARLAKLRGVLLDLLVAELPGSLATMRQRPALEAEIWACESQLAALKNDHERAERANAEAQRCQGEARRAAMLDAVERLEKLERQVGRGSEFGEELRRMAATP